MRYRRTIVIFEHRAGTVRRRYRGCRTALLAIAAVYTPLRLRRNERLPRVSTVLADALVFGPAGTDDSRLGPAPDASAIAATYDHAYRDRFAVLLILSVIDL